YKKRDRDNTLPLLHYCILPFTCITIGSSFFLITSLIIVYWSKSISASHIITLALVSPILTISSSSSNSSILYSNSSIASSSLCAIMSALFLPVILKNSIGHLPPDYMSSEKLYSTKPSCTNNNTLSESSGFKIAI